MVYVLRVSNGWIVDTKRSEKDRLMESAILVQEEVSREATDRKLVRAIEERGGRTREDDPK